MHCRINKNKVAAHVAYLHCSSVFCILPLEGHSSLGKAGCCLGFRNISCSMPICFIPAVTNSWHHS